jgi:hypothetical protein
MFHVMPNTPQHWRQRAEHARIMTDYLRGPRAKVAMMALAVSYEMLAVRAEQRGARSPYEDPLRDRSA